MPEIIKNNLDKIKKLNFPRELSITKIKNKTNSFQKKKKKIKISSLPASFLI